MKTFLLALIAISFLAAPSQAVENDRPLKGITGAFCGRLGRRHRSELPLVRRQAGPRGRASTHSRGTAVTVLEGEGLTVELIQDPSARPASGQPGSVHGFFKAGFAVKDLGKTLEQLRARGVEVAFGPFAAQDGQRANVIIRDNAGNLIQIFGN